MTRLHQLFDEQGQSPWLDNLRRGWITSGELQAWIDKGTWEVDIAGKKYPAIASLQPLYDPKSERVKM